MSVLGAKSVSGTYYELGSDAQMMNDAETDIAFDGPAGHQAVNLFKSYHSEGPIADRAAGRPPDAAQLGFYFASAGAVRGFEKVIGGRFKLGMRSGSTSDSAEGDAGSGALSTRTDTYSLRSSRPAETPRRPNAC